MILSEKLLGKSAPVMLANTAWGNNVSSNTAAISITSSTLLILNANHCWLDKSEVPCERIILRTELPNPLDDMLPMAITSNMMLTRNGEARLSAKLPKNQRMPPGLSIDCNGVEGIAAVRSHDKRISAIWAMPSSSVARYIQVRIILPRRC